MLKDTYLLRTAVCALCVGCTGQVFEVHEYKCCVWLLYLKSADEQLYDSVVNRTGRCGFCFS